VVLGLAVLVALSAGSRTTAPRLRAGQIAAGRPAAGQQAPAALTPRPLRIYHMSGQR